LPASVAVAAITHDPSAAECKCIVCRNKREFSMPDEVVDACKDGRLVVFAGAGISTETRTVLQGTLYETIAAEINEAGSSEPFPELMSAFVAAKGRRLLLQRIQERLDYVDAFPELRFAATRFHQELATLFYVSEIVTTNWDPY